MTTADDYQCEHAMWMDARATGIDDAEETKWVARLDAIWQSLDPEDQTKADAWVKEQTAYRKLHFLTHEDMTPGERRYLIFEGEYALVLAHNAHDVVFQLHGRELKISRGMLLDYDEEGRFWVSMDDAKQLGLIH